MSDEFTAVKGVVSLETDASVDQAIAKVEGDVKRMAQTVSDSAKKAGDAVGSIGDSAGNSSKKIGDATAYMTAAIQRATDMQERLSAGARGTAGFFGIQASQIGANVVALRPLLDGLDELARKQQAAKTSGNFLDAIQGEIAAVREQIIQQNQGTDALLRYKAAQAGASAEASHLITQLTNMRAAQAASTKAATDEAAAQRSAAQALATRSGFVESLRSQADAIGKTRSQLLELQAAQLGVSKEAAPFIAKLREAEQATTGNSHAMEGLSFQTAAAKRELLVLGHELSQGNFKNFGSSLLVLGERTGAASLLFSAATLTAGVFIAAVAGVAIAAAKGAAEMQHFQSALTLSGDAIGVTASQYGVLREQIGAIATQGKAAEVLGEIASTGRLAGDNIRLIGEAAILMEKATGQATAETVKQFAELAKSPAEAAAKLNESTNFLTASVYRQIKAFEENGNTVAAANLAEQTYAEALKGRAQSIIENAGFIEKAWRGITGAAKGAWDAMLGIGRQTTNVDQLGILQRNLSDRQSRNKELGIGDANGDTATTAGIKDQIGLLQGAERESRKLADIDAQRAAQARGEIEFQKIVEQNLNKRQHLEQEINRIREAGTAAGRSELEIQQQISRARQRFAETGGADALAGIRAQATEAQQAIDLLQSKLAAGDVTGLSKLTDAEKKVAEFQEKLKLTVDGTTRAHLQQALAVAQNTVALQKQEAAVTKQYEAYKKSRETIVQQTDAMVGQADAIREQAAQQNAANATFGKGKTAMQEYVLAQLKAQAVELDNTTTADPQYIASLNLKIDAQQRLVTSLQEATNKQLAFNNSQISVSNANEAELLQLQLSLLGASVQVRERLIEQRRIELEYDKKIAEVIRDLPDGEDRRARVAELNQQKLVAINNAATKQIADQWQRTADEINTSLTDAFVKAIEEGKGLFRNLRDAIKQLFANLVLKPIIQGVMAPISGALSGVTNGIGGSLFSSAGSSLSGVGSELLNGTLLSNAAAGFSGVGGSFASSVGAGLATDAMGATVAEGTAAATLGAGSSIGAGLAAIGPVGWAALAAVALYSIFGGKGGGPKTESGFGAGVPNRGDPAQAQGISQAIDAGYGTLAHQLGLSADKLNANVFFAQDPKGTAQTQLEVSTGSYSRVQRTGGLENVARGDAALQQAIAEETVRAIYAGLKASDLSQKFKDYLGEIDLSSAAKDLQARIDDVLHVSLITKDFAALGSAFSYVQDQSVAATKALIDAGGGFDKLNANLTSYYNDFYTAEEKRRSTAQQISKSLSGTGADLSADQILAMSRAQFRAAVEQFAAMGPSGEKAYLALIGVSSAFASITQAAGDLTSQVSDLTTQMQLAKDSAHTYAEYALLVARLKAGIPLTPTATPLPGHATGGIASGWSIVGENGPEVVNFTSPAQVYTNDQTKGMFSGSSDTAPILTELRDEMRELRAANEVVKGASLQTAAVLTYIKKNGMPLGEDLLAGA